MPSAALNARGRGSQLSQYNPVDYNVITGFGITTAYARWILTETERLSDIRLARIEAAPIN